MRMFKITKDDLKYFYKDIIIIIIVILTYMAINCSIIYNSNIYYSKIYKIIDFGDKKIPVSSVNKPSPWEDLTEDDRNKLRAASNLYYLTYDCMEYYGVKDIDTYMLYQYRLNYRHSIFKNYKVYKNFKNNYEGLIIVLEKNKLNFLIND